MPHSFVLNIKYFRDEIFREAADFAGEKIWNRIKSR